MSVKAYTSTMNYGDTADYTTTTTWTAIAKVKKFKPPKSVAKDIDITVLDSPNETEEFLAGLANGGEAEVNLRYDPVLSATLFALFRVTKAFKILYPDGSGWKFNAYINEYGDEEVVNGEIIMNGMKMKLTGLPFKFGTAGS